MYSRQYTTGPALHKARKPIHNHPLRPPARSVLKPPHQKKNDTLVEQQQDSFDELKQSMIQFMQKNGILYKETDDDGCETELMHDGVHQGDGCEGIVGRNRKTVDTRETIIDKTEEEQEEEEEGTDESDMHNGVQQGTEEKTQTSIEKQ